MASEAMSVPLAKSILMVGLEVMASLNMAVILSVFGFLTRLSPPLLVKELAVGRVISYLKIELETCVAILPAASLTSAVKV